MLLQWRFLDNCVADKLHAEPRHVLAQTAELLTLVKVCPPCAEVGFDPEVEGDSGAVDGLGAGLCVRGSIAEGDTRNVKLNLKAPSSTLAIPSRQSGKAAVCTTRGAARHNQNEGTRKAEAFGFPRPSPCASRWALARDKAAAVSAAPSADLK